jgi:RNA polymerase sigma-70 factor (ECF subfamily)
MIARLDRRIRPRVLSPRRTSPATCQGTRATSIAGGLAAVAETFAGRARAVHAVLVDGLPGAVWSAGGKPRVVFGFTISAGKIVAIDLLADPDHLAEIEVAGLDG